MFAAARLRQREWLDAFKRTGSQFLRHCMASRSRWHTVAAGVLSGTRRSSFGPSGSSACSTRSRDARPDRARGRDSFIETLRQDSQGPETKAARSLSVLATVWDASGTRGP